MQLWYIVKRKQTALHRGDQNIPSLGGTTPLGIGCPLSPPLPIWLPGRLIDRGGKDGLVRTDLALTLPPGLTGSQSLSLSTWRPLKDPN